MIPAPVHSWPVSLIGTFALALIGGGVVSLIVNPHDTWTVFAGVMCVVDGVGILFWLRWEFFQ